MHNWEFPGCCCCCCCWCIRGGGGGKEKEKKIDKKTRKRKKKWRLKKKIGQKKNKKNKKKKILLHWGLHLLQQFSKEYCRRWSLQCNKIDFFKLSQEHRKCSSNIFRPERTLVRCSFFFRGHTMVKVSLIKKNKRFFGSINKIKNSASLKLASGAVKIANCTKDSKECWNFVKEPLSSL